MYAANPNRAAENWDSWSNETGTLEQQIAKRWAKQINYCVNTLGCTRNDQICIQLQLSDSSLIMMDPDDGLGLTSGTPDKDEWDDSTVFTSGARSQFTSDYGNPFSALETELDNNYPSITVRPAFFLQDVEDQVTPYRFCGGKANGNYSDGTVAGGNWTYQLADARSTTGTGEIILHTAATAPKGGDSDRRLDDISITAATDIDGGWRQSGQLGFSRDAWVLADMVMESALDRSMYALARAVWTTSYTGGTPIKCGNYRMMCADHPSYPHRHRNSYGAPGTGGDLAVTHNPSYYTDFYGECQCPVLYPERELFESSPTAPAGGAFLSYTGEDERTMNYNHWRSQVKALKNSTIYNADLSIPWIQWPNIGNGQSGVYTNGNVYPWHRNDCDWLVSHLLTNGIYRGFFWSWNPTTQAAADATELTKALDRAYARLPNIGGPF